MNKQRRVFSLSSTELIRKSNISSDNAAKTLLTIARNLRAGELLDHQLADWLASAIEDSMTKPHEYRGKALLRELGLGALNRREKLDCLDFGKAVEALLEKGLDEKQAVNEASFNYKVDEKTGRKYFKKYKELRAKGLADAKAAAIAARDRIRDLERKVISEVLAKIRE